jgi:hypothetical protein
MHAFVPFLDLNANDIEPLRLLINSNNIRNIAGKEQALQIHLDVWKTGMPC